MKSNKGPAVAAAYIALLGALLALILWVAGLSARSLLLAAIVGSLIAPIMIRAIRVHLDLFEPVILANVALGIMFVGRPLHQLITGETIHLDYDILPTFNETLLVALIGIVFFQLGYFLRPNATAWARRLPAPPPLRLQRAAFAGWFYLLLGGLLFGAFLAQQGGLGLLFILLAGRQQSNNDLFLGSTGYLYGGLLIWAASALIFFAIATVARRRIYWLWFLLPTLCLVIFYSAQGTRSALLPLILAVPVFWYLWKNRRPSARSLLVAAFIGVALLGTLREVRTVGENRDFVGTLLVALSSPVSEALDILGGGDAEMFDSLANELLVVPERTPFQHGATVTDVLIRMVPRPLWPDKPLESNDAIVVALWPEHYAASRASPAFSLLGPFYADSGLFTVALGMFLIGWMLAVFWRWLYLHRTRPVAQMIYAMGLPFVVILMRGSIPDTLARMLFMFVPLVLFLTRFRFGPKSLRPRLDAGSESK
jgi:hypothetical protein